MTDEPSPDRPVLRVVRGEPTPEELAAVTVVLTALARRGPKPAAPPAGGWSDLSLRIRRIPAPGPGAWRNSAWS
ncbi:MAG TPA: acyl-CoA carboxylase subunit epsilon [Jatrophihabitans sp.]|nr:acyl-CoA carboxylase subunit epsilon [Jatrophihabitans sp.]